MKANIRVCHLTSVHPFRDNRIFSKECLSLVKAGYDVVLIAKHEKKEVVEGVTIVPFPPFKNRFTRILFSPFRMFRLARQQKAKLYHFHDPELMITGLLLRLFTGAPVVYDIHEDHKTAIRQKYYLPAAVAVIMAAFFAVIENLCSRFFVQILAEKYYKKRFPRGTCILNYPNYHITVQQSKAGANLLLTGQHRLLYTGVMGPDRGSRQHAGLLTHVRDVELYMVGFCRRAAADEMRAIAGAAANRLHLEGEEQFILPTRIKDYYEAGGWLAGLALFPMTSHYRLKELTKFFEYMAAGIPIICSNFPVWRELMETTGAGLAVDPLDPQAISAAVEYLKTHPQEAAQMGAKGRQAVEKEFNWGMAEKTLTALYDTLLA